MPCKEWTKSIKGVDDFELGLPRTSPLIYHCTAPESTKAEGLVFVIPDFNDDADSEGFRNLRAYLANEYNLLAVTVDYHYHCSRIKDGAHVSLGDAEFAALCELCGTHMVPLLDRSHLYNALKKLPRPYEFEFRITPVKGEYQDFGIMQALDHLCVLHDLGNNRQLCDFTTNVITLGTGYAGYLAQLMAKFAPNTIRTALSCTNIVNPPDNYLFGGESDIPPPYYYNIGKCRIAPKPHTHWSNQKGHRNYFSPNHRDIRNVALTAHTQTMRKATIFPCKFINYCNLDKHSALLNEKHNQIKLLVSSGFDARLINLGDSPGTSALFNNGDSALLLRFIFDEQRQNLHSLEAGSDFSMGTSLAYLCDDLIYGFEYGNWGCTPNLFKI